MVSNMTHLHRKVEFIYGRRLFGNQTLNVLNDGLKDLFDFKTVSILSYQWKLERVEIYIPSKDKAPIFNWNASVVLSSRNGDKTVEVSEVVVQPTNKVRLHTVLPIRQHHFFGLLRHFIVQRSHFISKKLLESVIQDHGSTNISYIR